MAREVCTPTEHALSANLVEGRNSQVYGECIAGRTPRVQVAEVTLAAMVRQLEMTTPLPSGLGREPCVSVLRSECGMVVAHFTHIDVDPEKVRRVVEEVAEELPKPDGRILTSTSTKPRGRCILRNLYAE